MDDVVVGQHVAVGAEITLGAGLRSRCVYGRLIARNRRWVSGSGTMRNFAPW